MAKSPPCSAARSTSFPAPWTCTYETGPPRAAQRASLDSQPPAFFHFRARSRFSQYFSGHAQARLAAARLLPPHRLFFRSTRAGSPLPRLRSPAHLLLHGQSRERLRPFHPLLCDSATRARLGARIPLRNSRLRLAHEAFRQRSRPRRAPPLQHQAHVAPHPGRDQSRHQPHHFSRSQAHPRRPRQRIPGRRLPPRAAARRPHRSRQPSRLLPASPCIYTTPSTPRTSRRTTFPPYATASAKSSPAQSKPHSIIAVRV